MSASCMKKAGVSMSDVAWLKAMRNSPVSQTELYRQARLRVRRTVRAYLDTLSNSSVPAN
jgi:hypothetical protein